MNILTKSPGRPVEVEPQSSEWAERAHHRLLSLFPDLAGAEANIEMEEENEGEQSGQGVIALRRGEAHIEVPFYIRDSQLQPLDVMVFEGEVMPLSEGRLRRYFLNAGDIGMVAPQQDPGAAPFGATNINNVGPNSPPYGGPMPKTAAAPVAAHDFLTAVATTAAPGRLQQKLAALPQAVFEAAHRAGPLAVDRLTKIAQCADRPAPAAKVFPCALHAEAIGPGQYKVAHLGPVDRFPWALDEYQVGGEQALRLFDAVGWPEALDVVDTLGAATFPVKRAAVAQADDFTDDLNTGPLSPGGAWVWDTNGQMHEGTVLHLHDWGGQPTKEALFLAPSGWASGPLEGQTKQASDTLTHQFIASLGIGPNAGAGTLSFARKVAWVWKEDDGWHTTPPLNVVSQQRTGDTFKVACLTPMGTRIDYRIAPTLAAMVPSQGTKHAAAFPFEGQTVLVPGHYWPIAVDMPEITPATAQAVKVGFATRRQSRIDPPLSITGGGGTYRAAHPLLKEAALNDTTLPVFLGCVGLAPTDQDAAMQKLSAEGTVRLWGTTLKEALTPAPAPPPIAAEKTASARMVYDYLARNEGTWWSLATEVSKIAEAIDPEAGEELADTGLSLAIADDDQMDLVGEALPCAEQALAHCAELLVLARKGDLAVSAEVIRKAMVALDGLVEELASLSDEEAGPGEVAPEEGLA